MTKLSPAAAQVLARAETVPWPERLFPPNCTEAEKAEIEAIHHAVNRYWQHARDQRALREAREALNICICALNTELNYLIPGQTWTADRAKVVAAAIDNGRKRLDTLAAVLEEGADGK